MRKPDWEYLEKAEFKTKEHLIASACELCLCGTGKDLELLIETLKFAAEDSTTKHEKTGRGWDQGCYQSAGHELAMKVLDSYGFVEHGSGIGWAWVSEDGERLLTMMDTLPNEEEEDEHEK